HRADHRRHQTSPHQRRSRRAQPRPDRRRAAAAGGRVRTASPGRLLTGTDDMTEHPSDGSKPEETQMDRTVAVTGGSGKLGRAVVAALIEEGWTVVIKIAVDHGVVAAVR